MKHKTLQEKLEYLEALANKVEQEEISINELLAIYKESSALIVEVKKEVETIENEIKTIEDEA